MARWLYKLGTWSARRAWVVVGAWVLVLSLLGTATLTLSRPFTSKMTIPGTEFQTVIDDLQSALPKAAGGSGTVVFSTSDGSSFTATQKQAIDQVIGQWDATDGVETATNPFTTQKDLDDAKSDVTDGRKELVDGEAKIVKNTKKLADAKVKIRKGRKTIAKNESKLDDGLAKLNAAQATIDRNKAKLRKAEATLAAGQKKLKAGKAKLVSGEKRLKQGLAASGLSVGQLPGTIAQLKGGIQQLEAQLGQLREQLGSEDPQVLALEGQLKAYQGQLSSLVGVQAKVGQLNAAKKKMKAGFAELAAGKKKLAAGRAQLVAGQAQVDANRAKISAGGTALVRAGHQLDDAWDEVVSGEKKLADGKIDLAEGKVDLERGERQLALTEGLRMVSKDENVAVAQVQFKLPKDQVSHETLVAITEAASGLGDSGVAVDYSKDIEEFDFQFGTEAIGLVIAAVVLLVMLGSLLAAGLPLLTALVGVGAGLLGVLTVTHWTDMTEVTPILALMLGLAVGIDYALFLVNRHRHQLVEGAELIDSIGRATGTAGSAVVVAGLTVVTALAALTLTGIPFLGTMGLAAAGTVAAAVVVSITLTPALLKFIGPRILSAKGRQKLAAKAAAKDGNKAAARTEKKGHRGKGWGGLATRHPWLALGASVATLGVLAIPASSLALGLPDGASEPKGSSANRAYTLISDSFGAGQNGTIIAVAKVPAATAAALDEDGLTDLKISVAERLKSTSGVHYVVPATESDDHQTLVFQIVPTTGPSDEATANLVNDLRAQRSEVLAATGTTSLGFAGQTVANIDISARLASALPGYLSVVVGISLVLLLLVFRSLWVPLMATGGFLLSVAASFGAVVAVYQWGWLGSLFGVEHPGVILSFLPTLAIGILFGLAMDYQMFLVSGMREAWAHGEDARTAVRSGFSHGAKVVTAAALIMISVFASFMHSNMTMVRPIGFALAIGILIDAFVVRMTIMPALMHLFGAKAWYLPKWLDRILPNLDVEGTTLETRPTEETAPGETHPSGRTDSPRQKAPVAEPTPA